MKIDDDDEWSLGDKVLATLVCILCSIVIGFVIYGLVTQCDWATPNLGLYQKCYEFNKR